jgi:hypothetical protein
VKFFPSAVAVAASAPSSTLDSPPPAHDAKRKDAAIAE